MTHDQANLKRDRRLRRRLLDTLHGARVGPLGGLYGRKLVDIVDTCSPPGQRSEGDAHAEGLLQDLVAKSLIAREDRRKRSSQPYGLDYLLYRITAAGSSLVEETYRPDPDIEDDRNLDND